MILLIIDMQMQFPTARRASVIAACRREINAARQQGFPIITVSYFDEPVIPRVRKAIDGYSKWIELRKSDDDGSDVVLGAIEQYGLDASEFRVCGVNIGACVGATVLGLARSIPKSKYVFVYDALNCDVSSTKRQSMTNIRMWLTLQEEVTTEVLTSRRVSVGTV